MTRHRTSSTTAQNQSILSRTLSNSSRRRRLAISAVLFGLGVTAFAIPGIASPSRTSSAATVVHSYVALGDSFTSGPGIPVQLGSGTMPSAPGQCLRSSENYPSLTARALGLALRDVSCSGATTRDLTASQGPGIPAQLSALRSSTSLVSIGIGGNDLGFSAIAANCAAVTPWGITKVGWSCRSHYTVNGANQLTVAVHRVGSRVATTLKEIRSRSPHARVFVIGYPDIFPSSGSGCWPMLPFSTHDLDYLRNIEMDLNSTLASDAAEAGDDYVDMATPSASHDPCADANSRWVEPLVLTSGGYPLHPSALGMADMAEIVERAFTSAESE
jgi:lysophospholipase L1-like esterase